MTKFYRFRSLDRILGKANAGGFRQGPGELEALSIYFASCDNLNDPLEDHKEIYWSGDKVLWENFIRHYLFTFFCTTLEYATDGESTPLPRTVNIKAKIRDLPKKGRTTFQRTAQKILHDDLLKGLLELLSKDSRKVSREELRYHLSSLHPWFAYVVFQELRKDNIKIDSLDRFKDYRSKQVEHYNIFIENFSTLKLESLYPTSEFVSEQLKLKSHFENREARPHKKNIILLLSEFQDAFLESVHLLITPSWYTACFMRECDNSSIWGTYGHNHTGICLIYKAEHGNGAPSINVKIPISRGRNGIEYNYGKLEFRKVNYEGEHVEYEFFRSIMQIPESYIHEYWYMNANGEKSKLLETLQTPESYEDYLNKFKILVTSKIDSWRHENEFRLVLENLDEQSQNSNYLFDSLEGLIFGIRTPLDEKIEIIRIAKDLCHKHNRKDFKFYQAKYDNASKKIIHQLMPLLMD